MDECEFVVVVDVWVSVGVGDVVVGGLMCMIDIGCFGEVVFGGFFGEDFDMFGFFGDIDMVILKNCYVCWVVFMVFEMFEVFDDDGGCFLFFDVINDFIYSFFCFWLVKLLIVVNVE